jgi:hypothetical protein
MPRQNNLLWPYGNKAAVLAVSFIWLGVALILFLTKMYLGWPDAESAKIAIPLAFAIGLLPLLLLILDYLAVRRGVLDVKGIKIDFSQTEITGAVVELPANIGQPGPLVSDSTPMEIVSTLKAATANEIVRLDIGDGHEWWVTRLFALSVGAVRAGSPKALVFVGQRPDIDNAFLGWAKPSALLQSLMPEHIGIKDATYNDIYQRTVTITKQVATFADPVNLTSVLPFPGAPPIRWSTSLNLPVDITRYLNDPRYTALGDAALEQILMDQLALHNLESKPDHLTLGRLQTLFADCLHTNAVDSDAPKEKQIAVLLQSHAPYVALVRNGRYEALVDRADVERLIIRQLFEQAKPENH